MVLHNFVALRGVEVLRGVVELGDGLYVAEVEDDVGLGNAELVDAVQGDAEPGDAELGDAEPDVPGGEEPSFQQRNE